MRTLGRKELIQSKLIRGDKTIYVSKTISATKKGNNGSPRP